MLTELRKRDLKNKREWARKGSQEHVKYNRRKIQPWEKKAPKATYCKTNRASQFKPGSTSKATAGKLEQEKATQPVDLPQDIIGTHAASRG